MKNRRAVFIDRDGVINRTEFRKGAERAPHRLEDFIYYPKVHEAVHSLKKAGFLVIVVTNQPDVARGWQEKATVDAMNKKVMQDLSVDDLKACFHTDEDRCLCRKPKPGMLTEAANLHGIDLSESYMVGDRESDLQAGIAAGCVPIFVSRDIPSKLAATQVTSLFEAAAWILNHELKLANLP